MNTSILHQRRRQTAEHAHLLLKNPKTPGYRSLTVETKDSGATYPHHLIYEEGEAIEPIVHYFTTASHFSSDYD
jgi:hypothetical protein